MSIFMCDFRIYLVALEVFVSGQFVIDKLIVEKSNLCHCNLDLEIG